MADVSNQQEEKKHEDKHNTAALITEVSLERDGI
ncbi:hypothetical protein KGM_211574 [Danaus plexippus plexippus]|uniref:Uncharacterized protein n=1 Tax=Danaus plexippus plexippus TaxID=278856 RepID=A0A212F3B3_DANPL|nr:hypothetical protein KGM_211574 [Danaus plexippus plexippus]